MNNTVDTSLFSLEMMEQEDDYTRTQLSKLAITLGRQIETGDENAIEAANILARILAENGFDLMELVRRLQKRANEEEDKENQDKENLRWTLHLDI